MRHKQHILNWHIWLPKFFFYLETVAIYYPKYSNEVTKRKYYDFIHNLPLFFPENPVGKIFLDLLDKYPLSPYLSSKLSFMKWIHYIKNKIKVKMGLKTNDFYQSLEEYFEHYKPKEMKDKNLKNTQKKYASFAICISLYL